MEKPEVELNENRLREALGRAWDINGRRGAWVEDVLPIIRDAIDPPEPALPDIELCVGSHRNKPDARHYWIRYGDKAWRLKLTENYVYLNDTTYGVGVLDITPLTPPPASRKLMDRIEKALTQEELSEDSPYVPCADAASLLKAVRAHTDPDLPGRLREIASRLRRAASIKRIDAVIPDIEALADELENGKT